MGARPCEIALSFTVKNRDCPIPLLSACNAMPVLLFVMLVDVVSVTANVVMPAPVENGCVEVVMVSVNDCACVVSGRRKVISIAAPIPLLIVYVAIFIP